MITLKGIAASPGLAMGPVRLLAQRHTTPQKRTVPNPAAEAARLRSAMAETARQLAGLYTATLAAAGAGAAAIFDIHRMMLEDEDYLDAVYGAIQADALCAEYAVHSAGRRFAGQLEQLDDEVMRQRAADVLDVSRRVLDVLEGRAARLPGGMAAPAVVAAQDLMPSQTVGMDPGKVLAFVLQDGAVTSHACILARGLGVPAVVGVGEGFGRLEQGALLLVDGDAGTVTTDPTPAALEAFKKKKKHMENAQKKLEKLKDLPAVTLDGARMALHANIRRPAEAAAALAQGAEGIGLFRSEYLYLEADDFPSEEAQYGAYRRVLEEMAPRRVVVRTLDLGADKQAPYFTPQPEENPALGHRGIRISLARPDIFTPQLRALLRAGVHGRLAVMLPMVCSPGEVRAAFALRDAAAAQLVAEGIPFSAAIEWGVMIETPAAVWAADQLAELVDFFSIGTNDLAQYTFAADRLNPRAAPLLDQGAVPLLRAVRHAVDEAHKRGLWVGLCGESAADLRLLPHYIAMGIDELSMAPGAIPAVKGAVRTLAKSDCEDAARRLLG